MSSRLSLSTSVRCLHDNPKTFSSFHCTTLFTVSVYSVFFTCMGQGVLNVFTSFFANANNTKKTRSTSVVDIE